MKATSRFSSPAQTTSFLCRSPKLGFRRQNINETSTRESCINVKVFPMFFISAVILSSSYLFSNFTPVYCKALWSDGEIFVSGFC